MPKQVTKPKIKERPKHYGRISVDLPPELYELLKKTMKKRGQNIRGFVVNLIADELDYDLGYDDD